MYMYKQYMHVYVDIILGQIYAKPINNLKVNQILFW